MKEFSSFLFAKREFLSAMEKDKNTHTSNEYKTLCALEGVFIFWEEPMKLEDIFTFENLYSAYKNCRKAKQHKGEVIRFEANLAVNLTLLRKELVTKQYKLGKYKKFIIYEPKKRIIEALPFKDRLVVRCFCDACLKEKIEKN